jgi:folate-dependent tRNA-U54 methylase TrmFO/GidA
MNSNWGLVDPLDARVSGKRARREALAERALADFLEWMGAQGLEPAPEADLAAAGA